MCDVRVSSSIRVRTRRRRAAFRSEALPPAGFSGERAQAARHRQQVFSPSHLASPCIWVLADLKQASCLRLPSGWDDRPCPCGTSNFSPSVVIKPWVHHFCHYLFGWFLSSSSYSSSLLFPRELLNRLTSEGALQ